MKNGTDAITALKSPNLDARHFGWQALHDIGMEVIPHLDPLYAAAKPHERARALWLLSHIKGAGDTFIERALDDPDESIRVVAPRAARQLNRRESFNLAKRIEHVVDDPSARVLIKAAIALRDVNTANAPELWARLAKRHNGDRWLLEALGLAAANRWTKCLES